MPHLVSNHLNMPSLNHGTLIPFKRVCGGGRGAGEKAPIYTGTFDTVCGGGRGAGEGRVINWVGAAGLGLMRVSVCLGR